MSEGTIFGYPVVMNDEALESSVSEDVVTFGDWGSMRMFWQYEARLTRALHRRWWHRLLALRGTVVWRVEFVE